jgi:hypothetical protein
MRPLAIVVICLLALFTLINAYTRESLSPASDPGTSELKTEQSRQP